MSKLYPDKNKSGGRVPAVKSQMVVAPSVVGGADKEYTIVFEKKATYKKPSFAR
ncbi:hypothetical protein [Paenibacillus foliorum]|uniref:hypothetical protein n=1 Tax=Paenibacillus foliorum TaxID=2654974 RepID=UPI001491C101|nr:hypothetical protein [Paenibacillus foliorum]